MWLHELSIKNFRKIEDIAIKFPRGLSVIVGENNAGKTAIIDALRIILFPGRDYEPLRLNEDDFRQKTGFAPIEISCTFCDLTEEDEVHFLESLVDIGEGKFSVKINARVTFNSVTRRADLKMWGGETEGGSWPSHLYDKLNSVYLKPLRDPETGLKPGRYSQISRLIHTLTGDNEHEHFENIINEANERIRKLVPVKDAKQDINKQIESIAGAELTQETDLIFSEPTFRRIIAGLHPKIEGLPFWLNGLGYNNVVFTAITLGTLSQSEHFSFRSILVEEPEAHLHPHLQVLLLKHLTNVAAEQQENEVQVIVTSHSPTLVSQAPIDSIISVYEYQGKVTTTSINTIDFSSVMKKKLQRFLDATRAELFFARKILLVEGITEVLLVPIFAKILGGSLKDSAVTIVNADGINFNAFLPLLGENGLSLPVVILTDGDSAKTGIPSATAIGLKSFEKTIPHLHVEMSSITLEHELALSEILLPHLLDAYENIHRDLGKTLKINIKNSQSNKDRADIFYTQFNNSKTSKGEFAQELADILEDKNLPGEAVPKYIRDALIHLGVVSSEEINEPN